MYNYIFILPVILKVTLELYYYAIFNEYRIINRADKDNFSFSRASQAGALESKLDVCVVKKQFMPFRYIDWLTCKSSVTNCSTHVYLPVLDFKPLVQPPAEKQRLCRNFLYVHTLKVYVDARTFFAQEFCQTQKIKRLNKNRKRLSAKRHVEAAPTFTTNAEMMGGWRQHFGKFHSQISVCLICPFSLRQGHGSFIKIRMPLTFSEWQTKSKPATAQKWNCYS